MKAFTSYLVIDEAGQRTFARAPEGSKHFEVVRSKIKHYTNIIIMLGHREATTFRMPVTLQRTDPKVPITEAEIENVVSRGLWKLFNQNRAAAAAKMRVPDIQVKVFDADILQVKLDKHRVADPLGFCARAFELECQETLVAAPALEALLKALPQEQVVSVQESPAAWPLLVCAQAQAGGPPEFLACRVLAHETVLYGYADGALQCVDTFNWGGADIQKGVAEFFGMEQSGAQAIIDLYTSGKASRNVLAKLEAVLSQELSILFKGIEAHRMERATRQVFIASSFRIPEALLSPRYLRKLGVSFIPTLLSPGWISEKLGYTLKSNKDPEGGASNDSVLAALAVHQELYKDAPLSKIARRRARWL